MKKINSLSAICTGLTGPAAIRVERTEIPKPGLNEVLIAVEAASLNFPDLLMTYGKYQYKPPLPFTVGMEGAGIVKFVGSDVTRYKTGDRVMFKGKTGACSEVVCVSEKYVERLPPNLTFEEGAAFAVTFSTAYISLAKRGYLKPGETLLVHGAGGGVGQAAVAVGKAMGAQVIAVASSPEKLNVARQSGADEGINYSEKNFPDRVLELTEQRGADVILDPVGGAVLNESVRCLAWNGRLLTVGFASGDFGNIPLQKLQECGGILLGVRAGEFSRRNPELGRQSFGELINLTARKNLRPWLGTRRPLAQMADALIEMESRNVVGKQVITINGDQHC